MTKHIEWHACFLAHRVYTCRPTHCW